MSDLAPASTPATTAHTSHTWSRIRGWAAVVVAGGWAGYFLFTGMPQLTLHVFPRTIALHALVGGMVLALLVSLALTRKLPGGTPLDIGVLAVAAAYAVATWASVAWRPSLEATLQASIGVIAFYALTGLPWLNATSLRRALMLTCGALALHALWVVGNDYADYLSLARRVDGLSMSNILPPTVPRVHDVSDHPNVLAMILALVLPFFALGALRRDRAERALGIAGLLAGGMAIFLTLSRGGWAGAAAGVAFTVIGVWTTQRLYDREQRGEPFSWVALLPPGFSPTAVAAVAGALALLIGGTLAFLANSSARPGWLFRSSLSPREDAWRAGYHIFLDHVWFGAGPNSFGLLYPQYARGNFLVYTQHAHNGFLQFADDMGLLGIGALVVLTATVVFALYRTWSRGTLEQRLLAIACAGGLLAFTVHNQVDAGNIWKAPAIALAFVAAIIARNYTEATAGVAPALHITGARLWRYGAAAGALAIVVLPLAAWYRIDRAHYDYWRGVEAANKAEPDPARWLQDAVNSDSSMMVYQLQLGQVLATQYEASRDRPRQLIDRAIIHLQRAVALDPRSDLAHANLAKAYQLAGQPAAAADEAQKTRFIARYHVPPVLMVGEVYEALGRTNDAVDTYAQVISMDAGLADSTYWQETAFRRQHLADILRRSALGINPCTEGAYLVQAHRYDPRASLAGLAAASNGCQLLVFARPDDLVLRVSFAKILEQQGRSSDALGHLQFAVKRQPDFGPARTELGRWYQAAGNLSEARHQWVVGGQLDEAESVMLLGDSYPAGHRPAGLADRLAALLKTSGSSVQNDIYSVLYYRMRYARLSPVAAMIPGDWKSAVPRLYAEMTASLARWQSGQGAPGAGQ
ncbi:MAG TPA: O-antigen ligase family protein [Dehalococcoidia bacterium]|nr:O-antigen ligase family protein [Dehalococcoidia bacterium]